ncbi:MAG: mandelate racemase/muconate lactonizing enzyme family protein [Candidatus Polarisedimenticolia bacterium]
MRLTEARAQVIPTPLSVPYRIAGITFDRVDLVMVSLRDGKGTPGYGTASPVAQLTGEDAAGTASTLQEEMLPAVVGRDVSDLEETIGRAAASAPRARAALAAFDIALHDLHARSRGVPLVTMLGGARRRLFTSITIGIGDPELMADTARRHARAGFRAIKVKIGENPDADLDAVRRIREAVGPSVAIRVDANQGYDAPTAAEVARLLDPLGVELIEQPVAVGDPLALRQAGLSTRIPVVADESVHVVEDFEPLRAAGAARGVNIKLMKCGGVLAARRLDQALSRAGWASLVGCMDESRASIAAAAHFAAAAESVAWIDLDGHFDLAADPFTGGVELVNGELVLSDAHGLGVSLPS